MGPSLLPSTSGTRTLCLRFLGCCLLMALAAAQCLQPGAYGVCVSPGACPILPLSSWVETSLWEVLVRLLWILLEDTHEPSFPNSRICLPIPPICRPSPPPRRRCFVLHLPSQQDPQSMVRWFLWCCLSAVLQLSPFSSRSLRVCKPSKTVITPVVVILSALET